MRAARLHEPGSPLVIEDIGEPKLRPGSVIVKVEAAFVAPSAADVVGGRLPFTLPPTPFTPGMDTIGVVEQVADDVVGIEKGQRVYCDHFIASQAAGAPPDASFIGYFGFTPASRGMLKRWRDGAYAERLLIPAESVTPLGAAEEIEPSPLARLGYLGTAYGGLLRAGLRPGQSLLVNGATGVVGVSTVLVGLAMGASRIVCVGRKVVVLDELRSLDTKRIVPVAYRNDGDDGNRIAEAARGADIMLDALGNVAELGPTMDAVGALRPGGTAVLVGGVTAELPISYRMLLAMDLTVRGSAWFPRAAAADMLRMIAAGTLDLGVLRPRTFPLGEVNEAIEAAARRPSGFEHVVLVPGGS